MRNWRYFCSDVSIQLIFLASVILWIDPTDKRSGAVVTRLCFLRDEANVSAKSSFSFFSANFLPCFLMNSTNLIRQVCGKSRGRRIARHEIEFLAGEDWRGRRWVGRARVGDREGWRVGHPVHSWAESPPPWASKRGSETPKTASKDPEKSRIRRGTGRGFFPPIFLSTRCFLRNHRRTVIMTWHFFLCCAFFRTAGTVVWSRKTVSKP